MGFLKPTLPPYTAGTWRAADFGERAKMATHSWALQGYGTPLGAYIFYAAKALFYLGGWLYWCSHGENLGGWRTLSEWWNQPFALEKAIVWSILFEGLGLGCGSGPLTGRYVPPFGGAFYFLHPGTLKAPRFPGAPLIGRPRRGILDCVVYIALIGSCVAALFATTAGSPWLWWVAALVCGIGLLDRTAFLATRPEHYLMMTLGFAWGEDGLAVALWIQLALWFWAGVSKLNAHFPSVVGVMVSNSPVLSFGWLRRRMYRDYPNDLRPSRLASVMGHVGTALELGIPVVFMASYFEPALSMLGLVMVIMLHSYIVSNVPMGVPNEWNIVVAYGAFVIWMPAADAVLWHIQSPVLMTLIGLTAGVLPLFGNLRPERVSFLLSMRYYAGNWPYSIWLVRKDARHKMRHAQGISKWLSEQLGAFYDTEVVEGVLSRMVAFRLMHLQGRILPSIIARLLPNLQEYEYMEGEVIAGMTLGWNFGDGHLHHEQLVREVQNASDFAPNELYVVCVEPQALGGETLSYRVSDAAQGELFRGKVRIDDLRAVQPWETMDDERMGIDSIMKQPQI